MLRYVTQYKCEYNEYNFTRLQEHINTDFVNSS